MGKILELLIVAVIFLFVGWRMGQESMRLELSKHILKRRNEVYGGVRADIEHEGSYVKALYWILREVNGRNWRKTASRIRSNASKKKK